MVSKHPLEASLIRDCNVHLLSKSSRKGLHLIVFPEDCNLHVSLQIKWSIGACGSSTVFVSYPSISICQNSKQQRLLKLGQTLNCCCATEPRDDAHQATRIPDMTVEILDHTNNKGQHLFIIFVLCKCLIA